jgi:galactose mutarotase-like enzyme
VDGRFARRRTGDARVWLCDSGLIPTRHAAQSVLLAFLEDGDLAAAPDLDHCFSGWRGEPFFCAEQVSAMPNAFNRQEPAELTGLSILAPGESCSASMRLDVASTIDR